jgi:glycosyltransferase involved in cell wall biosynthesis
MQPAPRISVVMAVFNAERYLTDAIESILHQSFRDFEFVIIDDGSTDESGKILRAFAQLDSRIRLFSEERRGLTRCLNRGIALAQGQYLARMDADDVALPGRFQAQVDYLDANPEVLAVGGQARLVSPEGWPLCQWTVPTGHEEIDATHIAGLAGQLVHPTSMMRLDAVRRIGGFNEQWAYAQDYDLWLRLAEIGRLSNLRETVLNYRLHFSSVTFTMRRSQCESVAGIAKSARARRGLPPLVPSLDLQSGEGRVGATARDSRERWYRMAIWGQEFSTATRIVCQLIQERPLCVSPWLGFARIAKALCRLATARRSL